MSLARGFLSGLSFPKALNVLSIYISYWGEEISLRWVQFDLRVAICCVGLAARNFGNGRGVLYARETIIASNGLQLLWEGMFFFVFCVHPV